MTYSSKNVDIKFSRLIHSFYPKCSSINRVLKYSFQATSGSKNNIIVNISYYLVLRTWMVTRVNSSKKKLKSHTELWRTCLSLNRRIVEIRDFLVDNDRLVFDARTVSNNSTKQAVSKLHATLSWLVPSDAALAPLPCTLVLLVFHAGRKYEMRVSVLLLASCAAPATVWSSHSSEVKFRGK